MELLQQFLNNSLLVSLATIAFFTIKGLLWLIIPAVVIRMRHRGKNISGTAK